jgi:hypothetical protein
MLAQGSGKSGQDVGPAGCTMLAFQPGHGAGAYAGHAGQLSLGQAALAAQLS